MLRRQMVDGKKQTFRLHREVMGLAVGDETQVDHINRDRLDCRRENLRVATHAENHQNVASLRGSGSRFRGVYWHKHHGKWAASAKLAGRKYSLGYFDREEDAGAAASAFRAEHMPFSVEVAA